MNEHIMGFSKSGIYLCTVCGLQKGALTTHCYGSALSYIIFHLVSDGTLDYKDNEWIEKNEA